MRTLKLTVAYDGTAYNGWQFQPDRPTVQGTIEAAIAAVTQETIRVTGSGRTDAGVHALGQVVSFRTASVLDVGVLKKALNANLPEDISVLAVEEAAEDFHAIRDAVRKRYRYVLYDDRVMNVFRRRYAWHVRKRLNDEAMHRAGQGLVGTHDFRSYETQGTPRESTIRTVYELSVTRGCGDDAGVVTLEIEANGFLYNMVRTIVGTLVQVGRGLQREMWPAEVLAACDRRLAGMTAPPAGLFLVCVEYGSSGGVADEIE